MQEHNNTHQHNTNNNKLLITKKEKSDKTKKITKYVIKNEKRC
jgi:hypothetical protein